MIMLDEVKDYFRNNKMTSLLYMRFRTLRHHSRFVIYNEKRVCSVSSDDETYRINLVLPNFYKSEVFGGISTAIKFFQEIVKCTGFESRIIISGSQKFSKSQSYNIDGYKHNDNLFYVSENNQIQVRKNDIFLCTSWLTAYYFFEVNKWQKKQYGNSHRIIYLIQDYEPGFYPWSTEYALAESTYIHNEDTVAVFNSKQLYDYFLKNNYIFEKKAFFTPMLNDGLKAVLDKTDRTKIKRKKRIIFYARPVENRNAFGIIYRALQIWDQKYKDASEWEILALGDRFKDIKLEHSTIKFLGKLSIEEYGKTMLNAYCGISLMISPHPSYPPLEMSSFGVKTITNSFAGKDLKDFNSNIISINNVDPMKLAKQIIEVCEKYDFDKGEVLLSDEYLSNKSFTNSVRYVCNEYINN